MVETLAQTLSRFVVGLRFEDLPAEVVADARLRILDTLAVMLAASAQPTAQAVRRAARALGSGHAAQIVGTHGFTTASLAVLVNGTNPGWAGHAGIVAAMLAQEGFTGPASGLDGTYGLFRSHAQDASYRFDFDAARGGLGTRWHMLDTAFKLYPCAHSIHAFAEAALALRVAHSLHPDEIAGWSWRLPAGSLARSPSRARPSWRRARPRMHGPACSMR